MRLLLVTGIALIAFAIMSTGAFAKNDGGTRPGWGFGDQNHEHTGPSGQSVHPIKDDDQDNNNDQGNQNQSNHESHEGNHDD